MLFVKFSYKVIYGYQRKLTEGQNIVIDESRFVAPHPYARAYILIKIQKLMYRYRSAGLAKAIV